MLDFITEGLQSFNECLSFTNNAPITLTLMVRILSRLFYKTVLCGQILCDFVEFFGKFSLIIDVSNDTKRKEIKKTTIGLSEFLFWCIKTGRTLHGFDFYVVNLPYTVL